MRISSTNYSIFKMHLCENSCVLLFIRSDFCLFFLKFFQHFFKILFLTSLLEYNCFTMLSQFLLYNKVNQLYVYIYPRISSLLRLPPTLPIPPLQVVTKHRADAHLYINMHVLNLPFNIFLFGSSVCHSVPSFLSSFRLNKYTFSIPFCVIFWLFCCTSLHCFLQWLLQGLQYESLSYHNLLKFNIYFV